jgi:hypothetical protein
MSEDCRDHWAAVGQMLCSSRPSMKLAPTTSRLLVRFDDPSRPSLRGEFASDGVRLWFTNAQDERDVRVAENRA